MRRTTTFIAALLISAPAAFAVGGDDSPPKPTETSTDCEAGQIWDEKTESCVDAEKQSVNDADRYRAVRELAWAGQYDRALRVIAAAEAPEAPRFLTYRGFIARQKGDMETAFEFYDRAIRADPDNLLARSYMGMGLAQMGDRAGAEEQLRQIALRGGAGSWPHAALRRAIETGDFATY